MAVMTKPIHSWCCLVLSFLYAGSAHAEVTALQWLDRMSQAVQQQNYQGTFVYLHGGRMESMGLIHRRDADGERERLYSLTGAAREVLRDNEKVTCILPDSESVMISASKPRSPLRAAWLQDLDLLAKTYDIYLDGQDRVIGRLARVIAVAPRDIYRYGHRLWLDVQTDLLLKSMVKDERGRIVEQMMFTELEVPAQISDADLQPALSGKGYSRHDDREVQVADHVSDIHESQWHATDLPMGFQLKHHNRHHKAGSDLEVEHLVYGDGLASVSVYIEEAGKEADVFRGVSHRGAVNAYGTLVEGYQITVVGEVPAAAVEKIGRSLQRRLPDHD